jgi:hypothetical protein
MSETASGAGQKSQESGIQSVPGAQGTTQAQPTLHDEMLNELKFFERYLSGEECSCDSRDGRYHAPRCASWSLLRNVRNLIARAESGR